MTQEVNTVGSDVSSGSEGEPEDIKTNAHTFQVGDNGYIIPVITTSIHIPSDVPVSDPAETYGAIALDVFIGFRSIPQLAQKYNMPAEMMQEIISSKQFRDELSQVQRKYNSQNSSGFVKRASLIAENSLPTISSIISDRSVAAKDRLKAISLVTEMAGLDNRGNTNQNTASAAVVMNIGPGIRGITD